MLRIPQPSSDPNDPLVCLTVYLLSTASQPEAEKSLTFGACVILELVDEAQGSSHRPPLLLHGVDVRKVPCICYPKMGMPWAWI